MVSSTLAVLSGLVLSIHADGARAGFAAHAQNNIAVYWGQNSASRADSQHRLGVYCANTPVNVIPIAFLNNIKSPTLVNFASASDNCTPFPGSQLLRCPEIEADIRTCQAAGKTLLLSIGGATYTEGGFASTQEAVAWADTVWAMFGPPPRRLDSTRNVMRPFGDAALDGFDFDFEATTRHMAPFAARLRALMDASTAATGHRYYLAAAPQCPFPDIAMDDVLQAVPLDFVSVQFYNNYCGATSFSQGGGGGGGGNFNFATWDTWARASRNPGIKVLLGVPGGPSAAGSGYVSGERLRAIIGYARQFPSFGGVMAWDMSQVHRNSGFLENVVAGLSGAVPPAQTTLWTAATARGPSPTLPPSAGQGGNTGEVPRWGQCGGKGYTGSTTCQAPYTCVQQSDWWAHCN